MWLAQVLRLNALALYSSRMSHAHLPVSAPVLRCFGLSNAWLVSCSVSDGSGRLAAAFPGGSLVFTGTPAQRLAASSLWSQ